MDQIVRCSGCNMDHRVDQFEVDRLGRRRKTCLSCKQKRVRYKCQHGRMPNLCHDCPAKQATSLCEHRRWRNRCKDCPPELATSMCEHRRQRAQCRECDPVGYLWLRACVRIHKAIGTETRAGRLTEELLGCDKQTYFNHIEAQFVGEMCWARIDEIEIDHRVPICYPGAAGGPPTLEEKVDRLHYRNCQPLWAQDNWVKGKRRADEPLPQPAPAEAPKAPQLTDDELTDLLAEFGF